MKKKIIVAVVAAVATLGFVAPAEAAPEAQAHIVGPVVVKDNRAYVTALYICSESDHLWVSTKQVGDRSKDERLTQPGSSEVVGMTGGGWWQSHPQSFECNGRWQIDTFAIGGADLEYGIGTLERGKGWLQFCLSYLAEEGEVLEVNEVRWVNVIRLK